MILQARRGNAKLIQYASIPLAFAYVVRPTNFISIIVITLYVFIYFRRYFFRYILWSVSIALLFFSINLSIYNSLLPYYYQTGKLHGDVVLFTALAGNLISPARGLLIYSPVFLLSFLGLWMKIRRRELEAEDYFLGVIILGHWFLISYFPHWWGGHSYGPRFFSDMIPYLIYFMIPLFKYFQTVQFKRTSIALVAVLIAISSFIHARGAFSRSVHDWNMIPINVDQRPERLWDYRDPQFLRGLFGTNREKSPEKADTISVKNNGSKN
jgi:hypothetical protein